MRGPLTRRRFRPFANLNPGVVNMLQHLGQVGRMSTSSPQIGQLPKMIGVGLGAAVGIVAFHDFAFGLSPSSSHLRATSSTLSARHRNSAASVIEAPPSIAALRSSMSISVQSAPS
jgi:hypothetical protein